MHMNHLVSIKDAEDLVARDGLPGGVQLVAHIVDIARLAVHLALGSRAARDVHIVAAFAVDPSPLLWVLAIVAPNKTALPYEMLLESQRPGTTVCTHAMDFTRKVPTYGTVLEDLSIRPFKAGAVAAHR